MGRPSLDLGTLGLKETFPYLFLSSTLSLLPISSLHLLLSFSPSFPLLFPPLLPVFTFSSSLPTFVLSPPLLFLLSPFPPLPSSSLSFRSPVSSFLPLPSSLPVLFAPASPLLPPFPPLARPPPLLPPRSLPLVFPRRALPPVCGCGPPRCFSAPVPRAPSVSCLSPRSLVSRRFPLCPLRPARPPVSPRLSSSCPLSFLRCLLPPLFACCACACVSGPPLVRCSLPCLRLCVRRLRRLPAPSSLLPAPFRAFSPAASRGLAFLFCLPRRPPAVSPALRFLPFVRRLCASLFSLAARPSFSPCRRLLLARVALALLLCPPARCSPALRSSSPRAFVRPSVLFFASCPLVRGVSPSPCFPSVCPPCPVPLAPPVLAPCCSPSRFAWSSLPPLPSALLSSRRPPLALLAAPRAFACRSSGLPLRRPPAARAFRALLRVRALPRSASALSRGAAVRCLSSLPALWRALSVAGCCARLPPRSRAARRGAPRFR